MTPRDWPTFWQSLTAQETADALRAAPKVATAWTYDEKERGWYRNATYGGIHTNVAGASAGGWWRFYEYTDGRGESVDEAKQAADAALVAKGWVLL